MSWYQFWMSDAFHFATFTLVFLQGLLLFYILWWNHCVSVYIKDNTYVNVCTVSNLSLWVQRVLEVNLNFRGKLNCWMVLLHFYYVSTLLTSVVLLLFPSALSWLVPFSWAIGYWKQGEAWVSEVCPFPGLRLVSQVLCLDDLNQIPQTLIGW